MADASENKENLSTALNELTVALRPIIELIRTFEEMCIKHLDTFAFWKNYLQMVTLLLVYISKVTSTHFQKCWLTILLETT